MFTVNESKEGFSEKHLKMLWCCFQSQIGYQTLGNISHIAYHIDSLPHVDPCVEEGLNILKCFDRFMETVRVVENTLIAVGIDERIFPLATLWFPVSDWRLTRSDPVIMNLKFGEFACRIFHAQIDSIVAFLVHNLIFFLFPPVGWWTLGESGVNTWATGR